MRLNIFKQIIEAVLNDFTAARRRREQLERYAYHDALTGLPNRYLLKDRLEQALVQARRHAHPFAVVFLDVDRFKSVNDSFGHHVGDEVLKHVGTRLMKVLRAGDTAARLGGDEFVLLLLDASDVESVHGAIGRIGEVLRQPIAIESKEFQVSCSVGVSRFPYDGSDAATLLKHADRNMYRDKARHVVDLQPDITAVWGDPGRHDSSYPTNHVPA